MCHVLSFSFLLFPPGWWEKYSRLGEITLLNFAWFADSCNNSCATRLRRVASERARARSDPPRIAGHDLAWVSHDEACRSVRCLLTHCRARLLRLSLSLSPRGNKYKSWAYASEVLFGVIRVTALSALLQPLKDRRRFSGREIFQTSFLFYLFSLCFSLLLSLSLSFSKRVSVLAARRIRGRNWWKEFVEIKKVGFAMQFVFFASGNHETWWNH